MKKCTIYVLNNYKITVLFYFWASTVFGKKFLKEKNNQRKPE